jgi:hypothetical protein
MRKTRLPIFSNFYFFFLYFFIIILQKKRPYVPVSSALRAPSSFLSIPAPRCAHAKNLEAVCASTIWVKWDFFWSVEFFLILRPEEIGEM